MRVKDVMITKVKSLSAGLSVGEALDILLENKISGLPVIDKENKLVGMFTEKSIIRNILPGYLEKVGSFIYQDDPKAIRKKLKELLQSHKVSDIMRKEVITVSPDTSLSEVAHTMLVEKIRRILVVDKEGKVAGIIVREDVLRAFLKEE